MSYGFGIVGLGLIADFHARAIQAMTGAQLVACCSRRQEKADAFAQKYGCAGYGTLDAFLSHSDLDIVTVCTPSGYHLEPALAAAQANKHLVVEKPLEITLERCDRIIEACDRRGVTLAGVFPSRFKDSAIVISQAVRDGRFGRLVLGDAYVKWFRSQEYYDHGGWHGTKELDGGGALMNQSILQFKNTSLVSVLAVPDLVYQGQMAAHDSFRPLETYTAIAVAYFVILFPLTLFVRHRERRLGSRS